MSPPRNTLVLALALVVIGASGCAQSGRRLVHGESPNERAGTPQSGRAPCTSPSEELNFSNQWVGPSFEGMRLNWVIRECNPPIADLPTRGNLVSYGYGDLQSKR
jgi:hypothetical protein